MLLLVHRRARGKGGLVWFNCRHALHAKDDKPPAFFSLLQILFCFPPFCNSVRHFSWLCSSSLEIKHRPWIYDEDHLLLASVSIKNQLTGAAFRPFVLSFGTSYLMNEKHSKGQTIRKLVSLLSTWWEVFIALRSGIKTYKLYTCKCCVKSCYCP